MLEKLAKQTAIYGISTILGRMLSYLLTPFYTRIFGVESYGIITDVYAHKFVATLKSTIIDSYHTVRDFNSCKAVATTKNTFVSIKNISKGKSYDILIRAYFKDGTYTTVDCGKFRLMA
mgnify:CR=1 FL=1